MKRKATKSTSTKRSGYEDKVAENLELNNLDFGYEDVTVEYVTKRKYKVDFSFKNGILLESKGYFKSSDRTKHLRIKEQNPDLDIRFLFQADNWLTSKKSSRYSDWCKRHGFKYHVSPTGEIPKEWIKEIKNATKKTNSRTTKRKGR